MLSYDEALKVLKNEKKDKYDKVKELLLKASESYYNTEELILTDEEYDTLFKKYYKLTNDFIFGANPDENKRIISIEHKYKNLTGTLTKCNKIKDFVEWYDSCREKLKLEPYQFPSLLITLKFDGNSVAIEYKNGKVEKALTRGKDGKGADLTSVFKDDTINYKKPCGIKYECIITDEDFKAYSELVGAEYVNARSLVSGLLGRLDCKNYRKFLTLVPLEIRYENNIKSREDSLEDFEIIFGDNSKIFDEAFIIEPEELSGKLTPKKIENIKNNIINELETFYNRMAKDRFNLNYMVDGIVIEIIDEDYRNALGYDTIGRPNYATALKFPYAQQITEVTKIDFCFGDSGRITPRVWFKPVKFFGATQNKQNIHSVKRFNELSLGVGTKIMIEYRNDCLTYVNKLNTEENSKIKPIPFTNVCPVCGQHSIKILKNSNNEETLAYCSNPICDGKIVGSLQNYVTKMGIKGIKENTFNKLKEKGLVRTIEDLYTLDYDLVEDVQGLGSKTAELLRKSFAEDNNEYFDYQILGSIGIQNIGITNAKLFCSNFDLFEVMNNVFKDDYYLESIRGKLLSIRGFDEIMVNNLIDGISDNFNLIEFLMKKLKIKSYKKELENNKSDKTYKIVFTGFRDPDLQNKLELMGNKITSSVSGQTDYVVAANPSENTVKIAKAIENGVKIISREELMKIFNL